MPAGNIRCGSVRTFEHGLQGSYLHSSSCKFRSGPSAFHTLIDCAIAIAADGTVDLATAGATVNSAVIKTAGLETIWVPAAAMRPTSSNGCAAITDVETTAGRPDLQVLDFDKDADEAAQFSIAFPKSWNEGTITFAQAAGAGAGNIRALVGDHVECVATSANEWYVSGSCQKAAAVVFA